VVPPGTSQAEVEVESLVLPAGAVIEVGGEPTAATDTGAGAVVAVGVVRWSRGHTPSGTSEEHY
jgi:hypothetical protein